MQSYQMQNAHNRLIQFKAREMGIECHLLIPGCEDFLELTHQGRTVVINKTRTHKMPLMAGLLAKNKEASNLLMQREGLPIPEYKVVQEITEEALDFLHACHIVTVKPLDSSQSAGVTLRIQTDAELLIAAETALIHSKRIMIQKYVPGVDYRILVIAGKVAGVLEYRPAFLIGDGHSTVEELIHQLNLEQIQRNKLGEEGSFRPVHVASKPVLSQLNQLGITRESVPEVGEGIELFTVGNLLANEISEVVTDRSCDICSFNEQAAIKAAEILGVDVAGVDVRCQDIGQPLAGENGGIIEVNALPDLIDPYLFLQGSYVDVFERYIRYLFEQ